ncbi:MAG: hypothetical protein NC453_17380, partial [Muribaculum sp.]|nr:hypothetical protein [Muribaculum sp.]
YRLYDGLEVAFDGYNNYRHLKQYLTLFLIIYNIPLFIISEPTEEFYKDIFKLYYILSVIYVIFAIPVFITTKFFRYGLSEAFVFIAEGAPILMMTIIYHSKKKQRIITIAILMAVVIMMLLGRRNKVVFFGGAFALAMGLNILSSKLALNAKMRYIMLILLCAAGVWYFMDDFSNFFDKVNLGMSSREQVIDDFYSDFNSHPDDWIWGRGIYGEFDGGVLNNSDDGLSRDGIENGYLYLILKGGLIWIVLLSLIAIKAMYLGLFKSNNFLCKGLSLLIVLYYLDMIGFGIPSMSIKYIMVFVAIAGCNSKRLRNCPDQFLEEKIGLK